MTRIRRITVSQIEGNDANNSDLNEIRPFGETGFYIDQTGGNDKLTLLMFDGQRTHLKSKVLAPGRLYGAEADSGDGNFYDTIKLIPDSNLYSQGSNQYLVVDPTDGSPGHIHIRAGGTQDSSSADLYLGGELTHVRVSDTSDDVVIRTTITGEGDIPRTWYFTVNGETIFPSGLTATPLGALVPGTRFVQSSNGTLQLVSTGNPAGITIVGWEEEVDTNGKIASMYFNTEYAAEGVAVVTGNLQATSHVWTFGNNGDLTFPDNSTQTTAWKGIPGPYADDTEAATAGVAVGNPYHKTGTGGQVFVRLS